MFSNLFNFQNKQKTDAGADQSNASGANGSAGNNKESKPFFGKKNKNKKQQQPEQIVQVRLVFFLF